MMRPRYSVLLFMISSTMLSFLPSSFATCLKASFVLSKAHSVTSFLKVFLYSSQSPPFRAVKAFLHHSLRTLSVIPAFNLLQVLFSSRFQLPRTPYSCLPLCFGLLSKPFYSCSSLAEMFPHLSYILFKAFHGAPSCAANSLHCQFVSVVFLWPSGTRCNISGTSW